MACRLLPLRVRCSRPWPSGTPTQGLMVDQSRPRESRAPTEILFESSPLFRSQNARFCLPHQADELTHVIPAGARHEKVFGLLAHSCMGGSENSPLILFQVTSSVSGKMRVSPTTDRKLASATHRGNTCI